MLDKLLLPFEDPMDSLNWVLKTEPSRMMRCVRFVKHSIDAEEELVNSIRYQKNTEVILSKKFRPVRVTNSFSCILSHQKLKYSGNEQFIFFGTTFCASLWVEGSVLYFVDDEDK